MYNESLNNIFELAQFYNKEPLLSSDINSDEPSLSELKADLEKCQKV